MYDKVIFSLEEKMIHFLYNLCLIDNTILGFNGEKIGMSREQLQSFGVGKDKKIYFKRESKV